MACTRTLCRLTGVQPPVTQAIEAVGDGRLDRSSLGVVACTGPCSLHLATMKLHPSLTGLHDIVIEAQGNDISGSDAKDFRREVLHDRLSPFWKPLNGSAHLNHARLPGR